MCHRARRRGLCGDWAGNAFGNCKDRYQSGDPSVNRNPQAQGSNRLLRRADGSGDTCITSVRSPGTDCCTAYVTDERQDALLREKAMFNITSLKVYKQIMPPTPPTPPSAPMPPSPPPVPPSPPADPPHLIPKDCYGAGDRFYTFAEGRPPAVEVAGTAVEVEVTSAEECAAACWGQKDDAEWPCSFWKFGVTGSWCLLWPGRDCTPAPPNSRPDENIGDESTKGADGTSFVFCQDLKWLRDGGVFRGSRRLALKAGQEGEGKGLPSSQQAQSSRLRQLQRVRPPPPSPNPPPLSPNPPPPLPRPPPPPSLPFGAGSGVKTGSAPGQGQGLGNVLYVNTVVLANGLVVGPDGTLLGSLRVDGMVVAPDGTVLGKRNPDGSVFRADSVGVISIYSGTIPG